MNEALNKNIEKNVAPYWRNHQSLKGTEIKSSNWHPIFTRLVLNELPFNPLEPLDKEAANNALKRYHE